MPEIKSIKKFLSMAKDLAESEPIRCLKGAKKLSDWELHEIAGLKADIENNLGEMQEILSSFNIEPYYGE